MQIATVEGRIDNWMEIDKLDGFEYFKLTQEKKDHIDIMLKYKQKIRKKVIAGTKSANVSTEELDTLVESSSDSSHGEYLKRYYPSAYE